MEQIVPYIKFIFIWETFLNDWQCLVLQQSNQVFIWSSVAKANSYPQGKQKVFLSEKKKSTSQMQIFTQTQVAGSFFKKFYHLNVNQLHWFPDVWCTIHMSGLSLNIFKYILIHLPVYGPPWWHVEGMCFLFEYNHRNNNKKNIIYLATKTKLLQKAQSGRNGRGLGYSLISLPRAN